MMATPVQTLNACPPDQQQQTPQKNSTESQESSNVALKNGTRLEEGKTEANVMVNSKAKASTTNAGQSMTMENFQDVGSANLNSDSAPFVPHSEVNNYAAGSGEQPATNEDYSKMSDSGHGSLAGYVAGYNNRPGYLADQHGGAQSDQQYSGQQYRAPYAPPSKMMAMGPPRAPNANMMPGYSTPPGHQRFLSGHSLSQPSGPTPTLNQLLQSPNPVHRGSQNSYTDYNPMGQGFGKGPPDLGYNWGPRSMSAYPQQGPAYRNQGGSMDHGQPSSLKRPGTQGPFMPGPAATYPPQQPSQSQGQYAPQFPPRYGASHGPQVRPSQIGMSNPSYPQHQMPQYNTQQGPPQQMTATFDQRPSQSYMPPQGSQTYPCIRPQQSSAGTPPAKENAELTQDASGTSGEEGSSEGNPGTPPTPVASHPSITALRPSSSPSGSRSMSPANSNQQSNIPVPPRPSSQSDSAGSQPTRMSQSPITAQTGYSQAMAPPHMAPPMYGNKMHPGMMGGSQQMGPYSPQSQQYSQGNYPRNQSSIGMPGYGSQTLPGSPANSMGQPYGMNRIGNHMPPQGYGGQYGQFASHGYGMSPSSGGGVAPNSLPGQSPNQGPPSQMITPTLMMNKGATGAQVAAQAAMVAAASSTSSRSPLHSKHQLQPKAYMMSSNCAPTGMSTGSGPMPSSRDSPGMPLPMPPPAVPTTPPTPSSTPTPNPPAVSSPESTPTPPSALSMIQCDVNSEQRTTNAGGMGNNSMIAGSVTTLPSSTLESAVQDEASQQSTASNTSNTEERAETPRPRKDIPHPPTPASALPSPGAASMSSLHDEFESVSSPSWPRTPASPVVNSQVHEYHPPPPTTSKRADNLSKLYDISDDPDRRAFLDRLVQFNEERGTAITQCPTISKQPLDLYKLYLVVKDRGGFVEVTKAKHWKDVAGQIGIGASSSAAYTLRKQYVKHLLPFECKFDRGGIDPQPIISSLEAATRKKSSSKANTAPSPAGSSNSQDSFPTSNSQSMDGFPTPPGPYNQYNQGGNTNTDYGGQMLGPHGSMSSGDSSHQSMLTNHNNESINVQNPFADEMPGHQYPRSGSGMPPPGIQNSYGAYSGSGSMPPRPQGMSATMPPPYSGTQGMPGPTSAPGSYSYNDQLRPLGPQGQEPYPNEQYRRGQGINHEGYGSRPTDSYPAPSSSYPPTRMPSTPPQYPYGSPQYDRERYEQRPGGMISSGQTMRPPSQSTMMQQHSSDSSSYPPPHRYSAPPVGSGETPVYPARPYSGPPPATQQPGFTSTAASNAVPTTVAAEFRQDQPYTMTSPTPSADSPQAHLTPDSPKKSQCYPSGSGQPAVYPNKMMPPQGYPQGPKRHPDFMKSSEQQYGAGPTYNQGQATQPPFSGWRGDTQFSSYGQSPSGQNSPREDWSNREQSGQWPRSYPPQSHYNQGSNMHVTANLNSQNPMGSNPPLRFMVQRIPPGFKDKQQPPYTMQQAKMQPGPQMNQNAQYPPKREITFPSDSIEAVAPVLVKRKRMLSKDVTPVEAWRLMMALKSGLLCESTWALDVLSVLLFDDSAVLYFSLQHLPGLLEVLMEHYRRCLTQAFGISEELEIGFTKQPKLETDDQWYCNSDDGSSSDEDDVDLGIVTDINVKDRISILDSENYTLKSHNGKVVKVVSKSDLFISDADKAWDTFEGFTGTSEHWQLGGGDTTLHIQTYFENGKSSVKFVRFMRDVKIPADEPTKCTTLKCIDRLISGENNDSENRTNSDCSKTLPDCYIKKEVLNNSDHSSLPNGATDEVSADSPLKTEIKMEMCMDCELRDSMSPEPSCQRPPIVVQSRPKRRRMDDYEDEAYNRDEPSLFLITDSQDSLLRRCICLSNILRSLSFVPGNDSEMSKHPGFLLVMGKLLLLHHNHALRRQNQRNYDKEEDSDFSDSCSSLHDHEWWWDGLHVLRENTLVTLANIAGQLDLSQYPEEIGLPILDGLLHWSVCPAAYAQDPLPTLPAHSVLSPQRLSLEALCKLSVQDNNVDLILATPPFSRIERLFGFLARSLSKQEDPVVREFAVVLLHYFAQAESGAARVIACQSTSVSLLVAFVEQAEQSALSIANTHGINMLRENPEMMGTSLDMLRRAANTLLALSRVPENRPLFLQHQQRLLSLVMSQILDQHVAAILADVLYECSQPSDGLL